MRISKVTCHQFHIVTFIILFFGIAPSSPKTIDPRLIVNADKGEWTLFVIPDTQHYSQNRGNAPCEYMKAGFEWLVTVRDQLNIKFVQGLGDITESGSNRDEWERGQQAWSQLYGKIPFAVNQGNHDSIYSINKYFPVEKFSSEPWWGGHYQGVHNSYQTFNFYGQDYLFVNIQSHDPWGTPNPGAREWANQVISAHPEHNVIVGTHDTIETSTIKQDILNSHDNIVLSNAGHSCAREVRFKTFGPNGGIAENFVVNYQCDSKETMQLRYYVFKPLEQNVFYYTYSPITNLFEQDYNSQGKFHIKMELGPSTNIQSQNWSSIKFR